MRAVVIVPHFEPDVAPTGAVMTRLVHELALRGHTIEVITSLPWYREHRIEPGYEGRLVRYEDTPWGRITRIHPFASTDKRNIGRRALGFLSFSAIATLLTARGEDADVVLAISPPLTLGVTGWVVARARKAPLVFNVQDVYPDVAVELGVLSNPAVVAGARCLERFCYERAQAVTVLSEDLKDNLAAKVSSPHKVRTIPNFVDTEWIKPVARESSYRKEFGLVGKFVIMYAGNVGLSQGLNVMVDAAAACRHVQDVIFVINGQGAARSELERQAQALDNVRFIDMQPTSRLPEVLAAANVHLVTLRRGLSRASVPSKTYSILAAGRPLVAAVDEGSEIARVVERARAGIPVPPEDPEALTKAIRRLIESRPEAERMGQAGRAFIERWLSPAAVAAAYESLFEELRAGEGKS